MLELSIQQLATANILLLNIEQYPLGDYLNFQIWGSSTAQAYIAKSNYFKIQQQKELASEVLRRFRLFCKNGFYKNGKLHLAIINKSLSI
jgi:hypothetical protein